MQCKGKGCRRVKGMSHMLFTTWDSRITTFIGLVWLSVISKSFPQKLFCIAADLRRFPILLKDTKLYLELSGMSCMFSAEIRQKVVNKMCSNPLLSLT